MIFVAPATSTANESFHSVAAHILRKQRNALLPQNVEAFALARVLLPDAVHRSAALKALEAEAVCCGVLDEAAVDEVLSSPLSSGSAE
jgi:hypothetical protein